MRLTKNRRLILQLLAETDGYDMPPYSVSSLMYDIETMIKYKWKGYEQYSPKSPPSEQQMHRTIKDLLMEGLIVGTKEIQEQHNGLPCRVIRYQLSTDVEKNFIITECSQLHRKVNKSKFGFNFFGVVMDYGMESGEVEKITAKVKAMMQKTHPDKQEGYVEQFNQMRECMELIRSGIPLPTDPYKKQQDLANVESISFL